MSCLTAGFGRRGDMSKGFRIVLMIAVVGAIVALGAGVLMAAEGDWPAVALEKDFRGTGGYLSWIKIIGCWLLFLMWVSTTDWLSIDCQALSLNYLRWNPIVFGTFMAAFVLVWLIPYFWVGFPLLLIAYIAPLATYIILRNKTVDNNRRVLTPEHIRYWLATRLSKIGVKIAAERLDPNEAGPPVKLLAQGGPDERTDTARLLLARQSPGFLTAREIIAAGLAGRAAALMLDYSHQGVAVRRLVDGVWIPAGEVKDRELGDPALESLKLLCGLNPKDRQNRQEGTFVAEYEKIRYDGTFSSQGTQGGERVVLQFEDKKVRLKTLDDLGMRTKLQEQLKALLSVHKGLALFSAPPAGGLRTMMDVVLHACDRYVCEFAAIEDEAIPYQPVENVPVTTYKSADGQSPVDVMPRLFRTEPNVVVVRDLVNAETLSLLCQEIAENRLIISTVRAKDCAEALLRVLVLGVPPAEIAKVVTVVVNQRLIRKLCDTCKEAYTPTPEMLRQLGIPAGRVQAFYRPPQPNPQEPKEPCKVCGGIGYLGRTAIFEVLQVGDAVRKTLDVNPKLDIVRQAARKDGMKSLQEEGVLLVIKGVTSLPELMRVMKG
jgi:type II secretory ATPase GspE/PulE/Tfp pilus assembly ATPase PilB-like protein